ncbi:hypothetical protein CTEN210_18145 [Chaetoceros tenuissimus]|uniref:PDZ domain-containing protein n=1 Tax=Chaetoceros tenuissimus TaxID=426638 RepID=A0AAD3HFW5_9STRA|nr:hypothetical protein CTEN210_18145 [Chaetoceros tenuissimus]
MKRSLALLSVLYSADVAFSFQQILASRPPLSAVTHENSFKRYSFQLRESSSSNSNSKSKSNTSRLGKKRRGVRMHLLKPVQILDSSSSASSSSSPRLKMISSGLTFDDGDQLLVSTQKPLGLVLEEIDKDVPNGCIVTEVVEGSNADKAGCKPGDILVAVQNADVSKADFDEVMQRIGNAPKVVNLRFWRRER